jgi:hypothetical protein
MVEIKFFITEEQHCEALRKKGIKKHHEVYLDALGIEYTPRKIGRPSLDEIRKTLNDTAALNRLNWRETIKNRLPKMDEVKASCEALDNTFENSQKKRGG